MPATFIAGIIRTISDSATLYITPGIPSRGRLRRGFTSCSVGQVAASVMVPGSACHLQDLGSSPIRTHLSSPIHHWEAVAYCPRVVPLGTAVEASVDPDPGMAGSPVDPAQDTVGCLVDPDLATAVIRVVPGLDTADYLADLDPGKADYQGVPDLAC
jgi:hypothetical protein